LSVDLRITPFVMDWFVDTSLVLARVCSASVSVVTLSIDDTNDTTSDLVAFSEPFRFLFC